MDGANNNNDNSLKLLYDALDNRSTRILAYQDRELGSSLAAQADLDDTHAYQETLLHKAVRIGDYDVVFRLLEWGACPYVKDFRGYDVLETASPSSSLLSEAKKRRIMAAILLLTEGCPKRICACKMKAIKNLSPEKEKHTIIKGPKKIPLFYRGLDPRGEERKSSSREKKSLYVLRYDDDN